MKLAMPLPPHETLHAIARIVLLYALFAALWILLSDAAVAWLFPGPANLQVASTLKGLAFVAVTAVLLFFLILRFAAQREAAGAPEVGAGGTAPTSSPQRALATSLVLLSLAFVLLGVASLRQTWNFHRDQEAQQLEAVAQLKAQQLASWLDERHRDAEVVRSAPIFHDSLPRWLASGAKAHHERLLAQLRSFRDILRYQDIALVDGDGRLLLSASGGWHSEGEALMATVRNAIAQERTLMTDFFRIETPPPPHVHFDFVAPLPGVAAALVLRVDVEKMLYPFLAEWPLPSASAETVLFRRDGDALVFLNEPRHRPGAALVERIPLDADNVLSVRLLRSAHSPGTLLEGWNASTARWSVANSTCCA